MSQRFLKIAAILVFTLVGLVSARAANDNAGRVPDPADAAGPPQLALSANQALPLPTSSALPRLAPELALQFVQKHAEWQSQMLSAYSDEVEVDAQLPDTSQKGDFRLIREYT